jgi:hypothetical protein
VIPNTEKEEISNRDESNVFKENDKIDLNDMRVAREPENVIYNHEK